MIAEHTVVFRANALDAIITAGIEVNKLDKLRGWIERIGNNSLSRSDHMQAAYLPVLIRKEIAKVKSEIKGQVVGVYHDGTTHDGESFAIVVRWCDEDLHIHTRVIRVAWLRGSMSNEDISAELLAALFEMGIKFENVFAWMHDCVEANQKSYRDTLMGACQYSDDDGCLPHTGSHVGEKFDSPVCDEYTGHYVAANAHSNKARVTFKDSTGESAAMKSMTR